MFYVLLCITLCPLSFYNHLDGEERAGLLCFVCLHAVSRVLRLFLMMPWAYLQFVIVVFPDHTHYFCYNFLKGISEMEIFKCALFAMHIQYQFKGLAETILKMFISFKICGCGPARLASISGLVLFWESNCLQ